MYTLVNTYLSVDQCKALQHIFEDFSRKENVKLDQIYLLINLPYI